MARQDDFEEQASGWLAVFSNENGNAAVCKVVFATRQQGLEWAVANFQRSGFGNIQVYEDRVAVVNAFREDSMVYRMVPVLQADANTAGADISLDHVETIR